MDRLRCVPLRVLHYQSNFSWVDSLGYMEPGMGRGVGRVGRAEDEVSRSLSYNYVNMCVEGNKAI